MIWKISGRGLEPKTVEADSFDEAIAKCREIEPGYATGQVNETIPTPENTVPFDFDEAMERLKDPDVQAEIKAMFGDGKEC